ncbi:hypothetical protein ACWD25_42790 [Streptomyces sp. NPDC002920]
MSEVITVAGEVRPDTLRQWLHDLAPGVEVKAVRPRHVEVRGLPWSMHVDTRDAGACDPTWWAAALIRRRARRVPDADERASAGLERVLADGMWSASGAPDSAVDTTTLVGVLVFKPGTLVSETSLTEVAVRLAECGYRVGNARVIPYEEIRRRRLGERHHGAYAELAARGQMSEEERQTFLETYGGPECVERFGPIEQLPVFAAQEAIDELGLPVDLLNRLNTEATLRHGVDSPGPDGPSRVGDSLFAQVITHPEYHGGLPFVVLNAHMPRILAEFHSADALALTIHTASRTPLPWPRVRREFCGVTDPALALPGSVRGDALAGLFPLAQRGGKPFERTSNGIHLSNGAFECAKDAWNWAGVPPETTPAGQALIARGLSPLALVSSPFVIVDGHRRVVQELTAGLEADKIADVLAAGRPMSFHDTEQPMETAR